MIVALTEKNLEIKIIDVYGINVGQELNTLERSTSTKYTEKATVFRTIKMVRSLILEIEWRITSLYLRKN